MHSWCSMIRKVLFLFALAWLPALQAAPPANIEIVFDVLHNGLAIAEVVEKLEHDGKTYRAIEIGKGRGAMAFLFQTKRMSRGLITPNGLRPQEFTDERSGRPTASASFDYAAKTLTMKYKGEPQVQPLPANPSDRLAFAFQFAFIESPASVVTLDLADGRGVSNQVYEPGGRIKIQVPAGEFETLRVVRRPDGPNDRTAELWLAPAYGYLPVRILVVEKDGTRTDQVATRVSKP